MNPVNPVIGSSSMMVDGVGELQPLSQSSAVCGKDDG